MKYQKIISFLDNTTNQWSKFRPKDLVKINDDHLETYDANNETKFKILILRSGLYDYSDPYINFRGISNPKYRNRRGRRK